METKIQKYNLVVQRYIMGLALDELKLHEVPNTDSYQVRRVQVQCNVYEEGGKYTETAKSTSLAVGL